MDDTEAAQATRDGGPGGLRRTSDISAARPGMPRKLEPRRNGIGMAGGTLLNEPDITGRGAGRARRVPWQGGPHGDDCSTSRRLRLNTRHDHTAWLTTSAVKR